jgi:hypothetical protein
MEHFWFSLLVSVLSAKVWGSVNKSDFSRNTEVTEKLLLLLVWMSSCFPSHSFSPNSATFPSHCGWHGKVTVFMLNSHCKIRSSLLNHSLSGNYKFISCHSVYLAFALHMLSVCFIYLYLEIPCLTAESIKRQHLVNVIH